MTHLQLYEGDVSPTVPNLIHDGLFVRFRVFINLLTFGSEPHGKERTIHFPSVLKGQKLFLNITMLSSLWSSFYLPQNTYVILHFCSWLNQNHGLVLVTEWGCTCRQLWCCFQHKRCPCIIKDSTLMIPRFHVLQRQNKDASVISDDYQSSFVTQV